MKRYKNAILWITRSLMLIAIILQNASVVGVGVTYLGESIYAQSAVQASQLSGELLLVAVGEMSKLILTVVLWVMLELTLREMLSKVEGRDNLQGTH